MKAFAPLLLHILLTNQQSPARGIGDHMKVGNGWNIQLYIKPTPFRNMDYDFWHNDCDDENSLCGHGHSPEDCKEQIIDFELEHPYFNEET